MVSNRFIAVVGRTDNAELVSFAEEQSRLFRTTDELINWLRVNQKSVADGFMLKLFCS